MPTWLMVDSGDTSLTLEANAKSNLINYFCSKKVGLKLTNDDGSMLFLISYFVSQWKLTELSSIF